MTPQQTFWHWFVQPEAEPFTFDPDREIEREKLFEGLATALQRVDPNLTFEFGPRETAREFVIGAGGIRSAFSRRPGLTLLLSRNLPHSGVERTLITDEAKIKRA